MNRLMAIGKIHWSTCLLDQPASQLASNQGACIHDFSDVLQSQLTHQGLLQLMSEPANEPFAFSNTFIKGNHGNEFNARFINSDIYGTRATTIITIDQENLCSITERVFDDKGFVKENKFEFTINNERVS